MGAFGISYKCIQTYTKFMLLVSAFILSSSSFLFHLCLCAHSSTSYGGPLLFQLLNSDKVDNRLTPPYWQCDHPLRESYWNSYCSQWLLQIFKKQDQNTPFCLLSPPLSPWERLYHHGDCSSFLLMTTLSRNVFNLNDIIFYDKNQQPIVFWGRPEFS